MSSVQVKCGGLGLRTLTTEPGCSKYQNQECLPDTRMRIPYMETQSPHFIVTWTLRGVVSGRAACPKQLLMRGTLGLLAAGVLRPVSAAVQLGVPLQHDGRRSAGLGFAQQSSLPGKPM